MNKNKLDVTTLNKVIKISKKILQVVFILSILALILIAFKILKDFGVFSFLGTVIGIMSPLFIGVIIAWCLEPFVNKLSKRGINRNISTVIVFCSFIAIVVLIFYLFIPVFLNQLDKMIEVVPKLINEIDSWCKGFFSSVSELYRVDLSEFQNELYSMMFNTFESITKELPRTAMNILISFFNGSINFLIGLVIGLYLLFDFNNIRRHFLKYIPFKLHGDVIDLGDSLGSNLKQFVSGTLFGTVVLFVFQSASFYIVGLDAPFVFGFICAVTNIIPYIGPYIGGIPAVLIAFTISNTTGFLTLLAVFLSQLLESYVLHPIIMSKSVKLHPVTIIVGLLLFGHFFGIMGMILSTPVISCMKVIFNFIETKLELFDRMNL